MCNQAIGETTIAIRTLLSEALGKDYSVTLVEPWSDFGTDKGVNLFLFRVEENPYMKNLSRQAAKPNPELNCYSQLSLDLYYLLTPYAPLAYDLKSDVAEGHRILGKAMQILHENPVLSNIPLPGYMNENYERIKIIPYSLNLDEMSKIWSMGGNPYRLSVAYQVSLVQITP